MYKKLGNYNNYSSVNKIKDPYIWVNTNGANGAPSKIRSKYPNGDPDTCDSIIVGQNDGQILTLEPDTYVSYYNTRNNLMKMKCSRDPKTNIGSVKCYDRENQINCCTDFSGPDDIPVIIGAISDSYKDVLKKLDPANKTSDNVNHPQCINLKQDDPPPPPPCCGVYTKGKCVPTGHYEKPSSSSSSGCVCNTGYTGRNCDTGALVPESAVTTLSPSQLDLIMNEPEGSDIFTACDVLFVKPWGGVTLSNPTVLHGNIVKGVRPEGGYLFTQTAYGPNVSVTATSPTGTERVHIDQTYCNTFVVDTGSNITTGGGSNVKSKGGDGNSHSGVVVIGPKIN